MGRFLDLLTDLKERIHQQPTSASVATWIKSELNRAAQNHTNVNNRWRSLVVEETLSLTANTDQYTIPLEWDKIISIHHRTDTAYEPIKPLNPETFASSFLDTATTDEPKYYMLNEAWGSLKYTNTPTGSLSAKVSVQSSSNSDTTQYLRVYGVEATSDLPTSESILMSGTTAKVSTNAYDKIYRLTMSASTTGDVTIKSNLLLSGSTLLSGTAISYIPHSFGTRTPNYKRLKFWPIPDGSYTAYVKVKLRQLEMTDDNDCSILPTDHDNAILLLAEYYINRDEKVLQKYEVEKTKLVRMENAEPSNLNEVQSSIVEPLGYIFNPDEVSFHGEITTS